MIPEPKAFKGIRGYIIPPERQDELPEDEKLTPEEWAQFMGLCVTSSLLGWEGPYVEVEDEP